jgi:hypothetical protein
MPDNGAEYGFLNGQIHIRVRLPDGTFADPEPCDLPAIPHIDDQFITEDDRAFTVTLVEWRFDLAGTPLESNGFPGPDYSQMFQVHLFCVEYPRVPEPQGLMEKLTPHLDQPTGVTLRQMLTGAAFDTAIFGGISAVLSQSWQVGLGTATIGLVVACLVGPLLHRHIVWRD